MTQKSPVVSRWPWEGPRPAGEVGWGGLSPCNRWHFPETASAISPIPQDILPIRPFPPTAGGRGLCSLPPESEHVHDSLITSRMWQKRRCVTSKARSQKVMQVHLCYSPEMLCKHLTVQGRPLQGSPRSLKGGCGLVWQTVQIGPSPQPAPTAKQALPEGPGVLEQRQDICAVPCVILSHRICEHYTMVAGHPNVLGGFLTQHKYPGNSGSASGRAFSLGSLPSSTHPASRSGPPLFRTPQCQPGFAAFPRGRK